MESRSTRPWPEDFETTALQLPLFSRERNSTRRCDWKPRFIISVRKPAALTHICHWFSLSLQTNASILLQIRSRPLLPIPYSSLRTIFFSVPPYIIWRIGSFVMMWWNESAEIWPSSAYTNNCVRVKDVCSTRPTFISCQLMPFCLPGIELHICVIGFPFHILKQFQLQYAQRLLAHGNRCDGECIAEDRIQFRSTFAILFSGCVRVRACLPACTHFK